MEKRTFSVTAQINDAYDVIVVGGGPSGCTAAAACAREGKKVLLIEATGALGGMGTMGLVPAWCPFSDGEQVVYRSLAETVFRRLRARMAEPYTGTGWQWVTIDAEQLKAVYDELVTENGASVRFDTRVCAVERSGSHIDYLLTTGTDGLTAWRADTYIDCTGDATLAFMAGATILENLATQLSTHCFSLGNVNESAYRALGTCHAYNPNSPIHPIAADEKYPLITDTHCCSSMTAPGTVTFNAGHLALDTTDPDDVSRGYIRGRQIAQEFRDALAEYAPEVFGNAVLTQTAPLMGVRQSRRVLGDYVLTVDDYYARRTFPDEIARNCYYLDVHGGEKLGIRPSRMEKGESHGIPYRCLTPVGFTNLLVAGRSISCDDYIQGSVRVMPPCLCTGEAAGIAAALSDGGDVHTLDVGALREKLRGYGAYIL